MRRRGSTDGEVREKGKERERERMGGVGIPGCRWLDILSDYVACAGISIVGDIDGDMDGGTGGGTWMVHKVCSSRDPMPAQGGEEQRWRM